MTDTAALGQRLPPFPLLLKPNAGGFGHGIQRVESLEELQEVVVAARASSTTWKNGETTTSGTEPPVLLQAYIEPQDQLIYRVWFLQGRVQCAVTRTVPTTTTSLVMKGTTAASFHNEFSSGCVGGNVGRHPLVTVVDPPDTATTTTTAFRAWKVPAEVADEVQRIAQVLQDAQAGSVEFLYGRDDGKRYYFDVNLLSTLPLPETKLANRDEVWSPSYDPWDELAAAIVVAEDQSHAISSVSEIR